MEVTIRQADAADLVVAFEVQREASNAAGMEIGNVVGPAEGSTPSKFRYELEHGVFLVAEIEGRMVGFGAVFHRQHVTFLATFYVRPDAQLAGLGVGQALLEALFEEARSIRAVVSSSVHRALAIYARNGMLPRWPLFMLDVLVEKLSIPSPDGYEVIVAEPSDPDLLVWDADIGNRGQRPSDLSFWINEYRARPFWIQRRGERVGYAFIQNLFESADAPWNPDTAFLGPIGVRDRGDAVPAVAAVVGTARSKARRLALDLPGAHPALPTLLNAGFRIFYQATFCSSSSVDVFDPSRYVPADTITL